MKETIKTSINFRANFSLRNITNKHEYHFMLQFNIDVHIGTRFSLEFQYILCYGSTESTEKAITAAVSFQYILCYGSTFYFPSNKDAPSIFQYILCYGSTNI